MGVEEYALGEAKSIAGMKLAFQGNGNGWFIYSPSAGKSLIAMGKGGKPDTNILKEFVAHAKQNKLKVFRGKAVKVIVDEKPVRFFDIQMKPPSAKMFLDMKNLASKSSVAAMMPPDDKSMFFDAKIHKKEASGDRDEDEGDEAQGVDESASVTAPATAPATAPTAPQMWPDTEIRIKLQKLLLGAKGDVGAILDELLAIEDGSGEEDAGLVAELLDQIEKKCNIKKALTLSDKKRDALIKEAQALVAELPGALKDARKTIQIALVAPPGSPPTPPPPPPPTPPPPPPPRPKGSSSGTDDASHDADRAEMMEVKKEAEAFLEKSEAMMAILLFTLSDSKAELVAEKLEKLREKVTKCGVCKPGSCGACVTDTRKMLQEAIKAIEDGQSESAPATDTSAL